MTDAPEPQAPRPATQPGGKRFSLMPLAVLGFWIVGSVAIYFVQRPQFFDHQIGNMITLILGFFMLVSLLVWFGSQASIPAAVRIAVPGLLVGAIAVFFMFYRIVDFSGELVPKFAYRYAPPADAQLESPAQASTAADLSLVSDLAFPQFLGPTMNLEYHAVKLASDWEANPPKQLWRQPIGAGWGGFAAVNGFAVTLEQRGPDEQINCYEIATGELAWSHSHAWRHETLMGGVGPRSTPTVAEGRVYALGAGGMLFCLAGETGDVLWQRDLLEDFGVSAEDDAKNIAWGRAASPLVVDDKVIVPAGGPTGEATSLVAYQVETGEEIWRGGNSQVSYATAALATLGGKQQVLIVNESSVAGHDLATGEELWSFPWPGVSNANASVSQAVALSAEQVLVSKGYGGGSAVLSVTPVEESWNVEAVWENTRMLKTKFTNVVVQGNVAYGLSDGILEAADLESGKRLWKRGRYGHGQILLVGEQLLVLAESGTVHLLDVSADGANELAEFDAISGKTWNTFALYGAKLLARNGQEAACYELPLAQ